MPTAMKPSLSKEVVSDSSDESGSDSVASPPPKAQASSKDAKMKHQPEKKPAPAEKARSPSDSSSESESESESEDQTTSHKEAPQNATGAKEISAKKRTTPSIPAKPFTPPDGYQPVQKQSSESTDISKSFSNLAGKQIWHITAPVGVPVKSVKELALDAVATGQPVLSHKGLDYRLREDQLGAEKTKVLLLPDNQGYAYRRNKQPVAQTFHVEQVVDIPNNTTLSSADTESTIKKLSKPLPSKPKHLRMRYKPFGTADGSPEDSEREEATFREPAGSSVVDRDGKKRKHTDVEASKSIQGPANADLDTKRDSPHKKKKKVHANPGDGAPTKADKESSRLTGPADEEHEVRGREKAQDHSSGHKKSQKRKDETSQERRARKDEKKRKRREKENAATG